MDRPTIPQELRKSESLCNGRNALFFKKKLKYMFLMMEKMLKIEITMFHVITRDISAPPPSI